MLMAEQCFGRDASQELSSRQNESSKL